LVQSHATSHCFFTICDVSVLFLTCNASSVMRQLERMNGVGTSGQNATPRADWTNQKLERGRDRPLPGTRCHPLRATCRGASPGDQTECLCVSARDRLRTAGGGCQVLQHPLPVRDRL